MSAPPPVNGRNGRNGRNGLVASLVDRVLTFIDKPWKAAAVVILIIVGASSWIVYKNSDRIIEAWLTPSSSELKISDIPEALDKLTTETDAELIQVWQVDLASNSQWFIAARRHDGERPVIPTPRRLPVIVHTSDVRVLINVLDGQPTCVDLETTGSPLARRLVERGMRRGCAVPIPPDPENLVGVIYLAWSKPTDPSSESVAVGAAREVAGQLATH